VIGPLATIACANRLAPAVLVSIGCGGLFAVLTVQSQAYFREPDPFKKFLWAFFAMEKFVNKIKIKWRPTRM
jgi:hypothetical protein